MAEYISKDKFIHFLFKEIAYFEETQTDIEIPISAALQSVVNEIKKFPSADVQPVTHCKDCVYRPYYEPSDSKSASDLVFPDYRFNLCPCRVEDFWYSWMPDDDWFCAYGKRMDGGDNA